MVLVSEMVELNTLNVDSKIMNKQELVNGPTLMSFYLADLFELHKGVIAIFVEPAE